MGKNSAKEGKKRTNKLTVYVERDGNPRGAGAWQIALFFRLTFRSNEVIFFGHFKNDNRNGLLYRRVRARARIWLRNIENRFDLNRRCGYAMPPSPLRILAVHRHGVHAGYLAKSRVFGLSFPFKKMERVSNEPIRAPLQNRWSHLSRVSMSRIGWQRNGLQLDAHLADFSSR